MPCEMCGERLREKWYYYYATIHHKRIALEKFCEERGYRAFFFDRSLHKKFYNELNSETLGVRRAGSPGTSDTGAV